MSEPGSVLEAQMQTLLTLVEQHQRSRCEQVLATARAKRSEIIGQAHHDGRRRMHEAIDTERRNAREKLEATRAQLQTRARQQQHKSALLLLHRGWELLGEAVLLRWKSPPQRRQWVCALLQQAMALLPARQWIIEHPPGWDHGECAELLPPVCEHCGSEPQLRANEQLHAGLRICADGACLDGTLAGLLADREAIEAQLLAQLNRLLSSDIAEGSR